jgi:hypothetical protein
MHLNWSDNKMKSQQILHCRNIPKYHTVGTIPKYHTVGTIPKYHTVGTIPKYHTVGTIPKYHTVGTIPKYHTVGTVPKSNIKTVERDEIDSLSIQIHDRSLSWLGTGTLK